MTWECHVEESATSKYNMILGRYILTALASNLKNPQQLIEAGDGPLKGMKETMIDLGRYKFKGLNTGKNT